MTAEEIKPRFYRVLWAILLIPAWLPLLSVKFMLDFIATCKDILIGNSFIYFEED